MRSAITYCRVCRRPIYHDRWRFIEYAQKAGGVGGASEIWLSDDPPLANLEDIAGKKGIRVFESTRKRLRMDHFYICYPPSSYRDWNDFLCKDGPIAIKNWIEPNTFKYESFYRVKEELGLL